MAMTLGKDVSALFADVLKNIATSDIEQKKLVYLYLMYPFTFLFFFFFFCLITRRSTTNKLD